MTNITPPGMAVVPHDAGAPLPAPAASPLLAPLTLAEVWTSLPQGTMKEKATLIGFLQGKAQALTDRVGQVIEVQHIVAHRVDRERLDEETGELATDVLTRCVLIGPDGTAYQASGKGIRQSLRLLFGMFGAAPWTPPLKLRVDPIKTNAQRVTYALTPVVEG